MEENKKRSPVGKIVGWAIALVVIGIVIRVILGVWGWVDILFVGGLRSVSTSTEPLELFAASNKNSNGTYTVTVALPNDEIETVDTFVTSDPVENSYLVADVMCVEYEKDGEGKKYIYHLYDEDLMRQSDLDKVDMDVQVALRGKPANEFIESVKFKSFDDLIATLGIFAVLMQICFFFLPIFFIIKAVVKAAKKGTLIVSDASMDNQTSVSFSGTIPKLVNSDNTSTDADNYSQDSADSNYSSANSSNDDDISDIERYLAGKCDTPSSEEPLEKKVYYRYEFDEEGNLQKIPYTDD